MSRLTTFRQRIDRLDAQLLTLLNRRAALALQVGRLKRRRRMGVFDGRREWEVVRRLLQTNRGPLSSTAVQRIFRAIMRQHRLLQKTSR